MLLGRRVASTLMRLIPEPEEELGVKSSHAMRDISGHQALEPKLFHHGLPRSPGTALTRVVSYFSCHTRAGTGHLGMAGISSGRTNEPADALWLVPASVAPRRGSPS